MYNNTLHLVLKHRWYDMIAAGIKREEYRDMKPCWEKQIWNKREEIRYVTFHRGYTNTTITKAVEDIVESTGRLEWGAEKNKKYYTIKLLD